MFEKLYRKHNEGNTFVYNIDRSYNSPVSNVLKGLEQIVADAYKDQRKVSRHRRRVLDAVLYLDSVSCRQRTKELPNGGYTHNINPLTLIPCRNYVVEINEGNQYLVIDAQQELTNRYQRLAVNVSRAFMLLGLVGSVAGGISVEHSINNMWAGIATFSSMYAGFLAAGHYVSKFFRNKSSFVGYGIDLVQSKQ